jgi:hypothetical protein
MTSLFDFINEFNTFLDSSGFSSLWVKIFVSEHLFSGSGLDRIRVSEA